jgi:homoserine kinase
MQDKIHQPYRRTLIPGLTEILQSLNPRTQPGLLGICLSGAGPTILALATDHFSEISDRISIRFNSQRFACQWKLLEPAESGTTVERKRI